MAPRSSWKGFIKLSLVSVPVKAFTANNTDEEIRLNQLHKECHARVKYQKICPEHGVLKSDEIVSGYEFTKDQYVVIDPDELSKLRTESDRSINILGFVKPTDVDPVYLAGKTYYLMPDGAAGGKPYALLQEGMADNDVHAIAQIVLSKREQLVLLRPVENMLAISVINYAKRVRSRDEFSDELDSLETTPEERKLAETLIQASTLAEFSISDYKDEYTEKLSHLINMKVEGKEVVQAAAPEEPKIINLMDALKQSVAAAQSASGKKMAPSRKESPGADSKKSSRKKSG